MVEGGREGYVMGWGRAERSRSGQGREGNSSCGCSRILSPFLGLIFQLGSAQTCACDFTVTSPSVPIGAARGYPGGKGRPSMLEIVEAILVQLHHSVVS